MAKQERRPPPRRGCRIQKPAYRTTKFNFKKRLPPKVQDSILGGEARIPNLTWLKYGRVVHIEKFNTREWHSIAPIEDLLKVRPDVEDKELDENPIIITQPPRNEEINTSKAFRTSNVLRKDLTTNREQPNPDNADKATPKPVIEPLSEQYTEYASNNDSGMPHEHPDSQSVDPKISHKDDWLLLEGYVVTWVCHARGDLSRFPLYQPISDVRTCVLRLLDIVRGIRWLLRNPNAGPNAQPAGCFEIGSFPRRLPEEDTRRAIFSYQMNHVLGQLIDPRSQCESLKILVGEVPDDVKPGDLEEFTFPMKDSDPILGSWNQIQGYYIGPQLEVWRSIHDEWVDDVLGSDDGLPVRNFSRLAQEFCYWLSTPRGRQWLRNTRAGQAWLQTEHGWQWLVWSEYGLDFLESDKGIQWLSSKQAATFLKSEYAKHWAQLGKAPAEEGGPDKARSRAWYSTRYGVKWYYKNCPGGIAPKSTLEEPQWKSQPAEERPTKYEFHTDFDDDPRLGRLSDLFTHIPENISLVRYRGGYDLIVETSYYSTSGREKAIRYYKEEEGLDYTQQKAHS
ncbi:hypothetical protein F5Y10DRAFT_289611 [Nemania abortiva]|nr:hypothetical protein F5Y10DRAFT_289611 [Nemania abortiva]